MKRILATVATATLALGGLVATATSASAHTPNVDARCGSLTVDLRQYAERDRGRENTVTIVVDGETKVQESFGREFSRTISLDRSVAHEWTVEVDAWDGDRWNEKKSDRIAACDGSGDKDKGKGGHHGGGGWGGKDEGDEREVETAFYVYPKVNPDAPAAWENSGRQTLIAVRDGDEFWEELPAEYPGELFDVAELPADVCEGSWGVQQDTVGIHRGFDWADYVHITYPDGPLFKDLRKWRHSELADILPQCGETPSDEVVAPEVPALEGTCVADDRRLVTPPSTDKVTYTEVDGGILATPTDGNTFGDLPAGYESRDGGAAYYPLEAAAVTDDLCTPEPVETTPDVPTVTDLCGVENDDLVVPDSTDQITYSSTAEGVLATAAEGVTLVGLPEGYTAVDESTALYAVDETSFTDEECALVPGDIGAVCESDVPYLAYAVSLPDGVEADGDTPLTVTFLNPDGADHVTTDLPLEGRLLWPGASADEPKQWPGWELVDGSYVETDGNFAWTREGVQVLFEVNPDYSTVVEYPEATTECANPPSDVRLAAQDVAVDATDVDEVAATEAELPRTGATVGVAAAVAALLLAAGATLFLVRRRLRS